VPHVSLTQILAPARAGGYGVLSLLAGNLEMIAGAVRAAEEKGAPLILAFNAEMVPDIPMELGLSLAVNAAQRARVPVATILDHGDSPEAIVRAIRLGCSSVMLDGSALPYEENAAQTREVVRLAHACGVSVEAELGSIGGSALEVAGGSNESTFTEPESAAQFVGRTGVDALAVSVGNMHGQYRGEPRIDLDRLRAISACVQVRDLFAETGPEALVYHHLVSRSTQFFCRETKRLIDLVGGAGVYSDWFS
jgi:ketose-bisphosphate aldolase